MATKRNDPEKAIQQEPGQEGGSQEGSQTEGQEGQEVASSVGTTTPAEKQIRPEVESTPPQDVKVTVLLDPNTGVPLRDQNPGVPNSPWAGKHTVHDTDNQHLAKPQEDRLTKDLEE